MISKLFRAALRMGRFLVSRYRRNWGKVQGGPLGRLRRRALLVGAAASALLMVLNWPQSFASAVTSFCQTSALQPVLGDLCGRLDVPDIPTRAERIAWADMRKEECQALRTYLAAYPKSPFASEAKQRLARRNLEIGADWTRRSELWRHQYMPTGARFSSAVAATADANARALTDARSVCVPDNEHRRTMSTTITNARAQCRPSDGAIVCALHYEIYCKVELREPAEVCR